VKSGDETCAECYLDTEDGGDSRTHYEAHHLRSHAAGRVRPFPARRIKSSAGWLSLAQRFACPERNIVKTFCQSLLGKGRKGM